MKTLAERIRSSRLKSGLSQGDLAEQTHLTQQMISKLESGTSQSTSAMLDIAKTLRVSVHWLWLGQDSSTLSPLFYSDEIVQEAWLSLTDEQRTYVCEYILEMRKLNAND